MPARRTIAPTRRGPRRPSATRKLSRATETAWGDDYGSSRRLRALGCLRRPGNAGRELRHVEAVQPACVGGQHLCLRLRGQVAQVAPDALDRIRPGRIGVGKIVRPHEIVLAPPLQIAAADRIAEEAGKDLVANVLAKVLRERRRVHAAEAAIVVIPLLDHEGEPAGFVFHAYEPELRVSLQYA